LAFLLIMSIQRFRFGSSITTNGERRIGHLLSAVFSAPAALQSLYFLTNLSAAEFRQ
jgi:hypothetical protein